MRAVKERTQRSVEVDERLPLLRQRCGKLEVKFGSASRNENDRQYFFSARHRSVQISPLIRRNPVFAKSNVILLIEPHRMSSLGKAKSFATASDINPPGEGRNRLRRKFLSPSLSLFSDSSHFSFVCDKKERAEGWHLQNDFGRNASATRAI